MKKVYDELGREIPTFKQMGITPEIEAREMAKGGESFDRFYLARKEAWQLVNERKKAQRIAARNDMASTKFKEHWYNSLGDAKVKEVILRVVEKKDSVFEVFLKKISIKSPLYGYYFDLLDRVTAENFTKPVLSYDKIRKFPEYDSADESLVGSSHAFVRLFVACFPSKKKRLQKMKLG